MRFFLTLILIICLVSPALAQNTGGVFPPGFGPDHRSAQLRFTLDPDNGDWASRGHYQQSVNDKVLWRIVGQVRDTGSSGLDFDFVQGEVFWQLTPRDGGYETGLRFDGRLRDDNRPNQVGLNWMNQWDLDEAWQVRLVGLSTLQFGDNSNDDVLIEARGQIQKSLTNGYNVGVQLYSPLGDMDDIKFLKGTSVSAGPYVSLPIGGGRSIFVQTLFGMTDNARDAELRLWLTQNF